MTSSITTTSLNYLVEETGVFAPRTEGIYAHYVQDTAQALLDMSRVKPESVRDITTKTPIQQRLIRDHKFVAFDLDPKQGCEECDSLTTEERTFRSKGSLQLQALILSVSHRQSGTIGDLQLIVNAWGDGNQPIYAGSHCTITLTTQNQVHVTRHQPYLHNPNGPKVRLETLAFVEYLHGITPQIGDERACQDEGSLELLGFPDAANYVTTRLPLLPIYLRQLTDRLRCSHIG